MASSPLSDEIVRFGEYEANLRSRELRRDGVSVRLPDQSFQVLVMLLERPGELVDREEIQKRLWSDDTFVDFDHGLNNVVKRLRDALGDSAESPRFVETLPRRGYRFISPVEWTVASRSNAVTREPEFAAPPEPAQAAPGVPLPPASASAPAVVSLLFISGRSAPCTWRSAER
jgi:DNA-binding winged helix-turn-helix (wHTH) protein